MPRMPSAAWEWALRQPMSSWIDATLLPPDFCRSKKHCFKPQSGRCAKMGTLPKPPLPTCWRSQNSPQKKCEKRRNNRFKLRSPSYVQADHLRQKKCCFFSPEKQEENSTSNVSHLLEANHLTSSNLELVILDLFDILNAGVCGKYIYIDR